MDEVYICCENSRSHLKLRISIGLLVRELHLGIS